MAQKKLETISYQDAYCKVMLNGNGGPQGRRRLRSAATVIAHAPNPATVTRILSSWVRRASLVARREEIGEQAAQERLLPDLIASLEKHGQRKPTVFQQAAIFALHYGLGSAELMPHLRRMNRQEKGGTATWMGRGKPAAHCSKAGLAASN